MKPGLMKRAIVASMLGDKVVEDDRHAPLAGTRGVSKAILEDHQAGFLGRVILLGNVERLLASVAGESLRVGQLVFGDLALGHAALFLGVRAEDVLGVIVRLLGVGAKASHAHQGKPIGG
jgi:hypothetical protein